MPELKNPAISSFLKNLFFLIPSEIIVLYITIETFIPKTLFASLFVSIPLTLLTPIYLIFAMKVKRISQVILSSIGFVVWLFALGGPFEFFSWYVKDGSWISGVILGIFTLIPPIIYGYRLPSTSTTEYFSWRQI